MEEIGSRIRYLRKKLGLTQVEFAKNLGVSNSYVSKLEAGVETPSDILTTLISLKFGVSQIWLTCGLGSMAPERYDGEVKRYRNEGMQLAIDDFASLLEQLNSSELFAARKAVYGMLEKIKKVIEICSDDSNLCETILTLYIGIVSSITELLTNAKEMYSVSPSIEGLHAFHQSYNIIQRNVHEDIAEISMLCEECIISESKNGKQQ